MFLLFQNKCALRLPICNTKITNTYLTKFVLMRGNVKGTKALIYNIVGMERNVSSILTIYFLKL